MDKNPAWLIENSDGTIEIRFEERPLIIDSTEVKALTMREPTVDDQITAQRAKGGEGEAEVTLIANLVELPPATIRSLPIRQYTRLQAALAVFYA
ncbi:hypothetical protein GCM10016455_05450 [Aliiroseovarius zhejiangensis]|uniref:Phage tail assembly protein n=1 Tax=Aliiroseovarius zhejiangensis TaxID=1632025 RepID=A0ABQ3IPD2_9RHOB|nr:phage tail assembly protein [Aliiroseovarius zhejiangensis]GHE88229.1 hypothetical protein GCM10016455_05450 [Aliiroseovarius zhejiangensis]